jgi:hypothetical protein
MREPNSAATYGATNRSATAALNGWEATSGMNGDSQVISGRQGRLVADRPIGPSHGSRYVPEPPSDEERYSYFGRPARWQFGWLFVAQLLIIYSYVNVMAKSPVLWPGFILLTFMVPPTLVNFWLRIRPQRTSLSEHIDKVAQWRLSNVELPAIDIFVPVCGEDDEVINNTCFHISRLEYGRPLNVYVLDDANLARTQTTSSALILVRGRRRAISFTRST